MWAGGGGGHVYDSAAMLSREGRQWGNCDGKEEVVEEDDNGVTVAASGGSGRQNDRFNESSTMPDATVGRKKVNKIIPSLIFCLVHC